MAVEVENDKAVGAAGEASPAIPISRVMWAMAGLFVLNLLLRVFYLRFDFVNGDETVRALTAVNMLDGARLYADVVTDKPPGTTFFYAAVFALIGRSMAAVHAAAALWNFGTAIILYRTAARFYGRRVGLWAALLLVYFSTNYLTQDMMAANTEVLMVLPYSASFLLFAIARGTGLRDGEARGASGAFLLFASGALTAVATLFKQVGIFNLGFFFAYEVFVLAALWRRDRAGRGRAALGAVGRLALIGLGFAAVMGVFALWLRAIGALEDFWRYAVVLNFFYIGAVPKELWVRFMIGRTLGYVFFNFPLWWMAVWMSWGAAKNLWRRWRSGEVFEESDQATGAIALWGLASLAAVFTGGRFFGHYFIQVLPVLVLLSAIGIERFRERLRNAGQQRRARIIATVLICFCIFSFVRFHQRTVILAYETVTGKRTRWSQNWGMSKREIEAAAVSDAARQRLGEGEYLYIWDYALDVYWRTGTKPASRFLTPYYITGKFTDATAPVDTSLPFWREVRARFLEDLKRTRPRLILDVPGKFLELPYPEIVDYVRENYRPAGQLGTDPGRPFLVYELRSAPLRGAGVGF